MDPGTLRTVLNVHGDGATREAVSRLLEAEGLRPRAVASADEARAELRCDGGLAAGLVLLDASLQTVEPFCRELRQGPLPPPLVLTRAAGVEPPASLLALADDELHQPPDPSRWAATIRTWLRVGSRLQEARAEAGRWRSILDAIDEGMAVLGPEGLIRWCNPAMARLLGAGADSPALLGRSLAECAAALTPADRPWPFERTLRGGSRSRDEWERGHRWFRSTASPVRDASGALGGVVATLEDVTNEVRLRLRIAQAEAEAEARAEQINRLERDARLYQALAALPIGAAGLDAAQRPPLGRHLPEVFCDALEEFGQVLDLRLLRRGYRAPDQADGSALLTALAERLAAAGAGPRDVVELHAMALRQRSAGARAARSAAYSEEGQLAVLELMGRLAEHYRAGLAAATRPGAVASVRSPDPSE